MMQYEIIKRPLITEKTNIQKEIANQLTFEVDRRANRIEIKRAIETAFKVRVASVIPDSSDRARASTRSP